MKLNRGLLAAVLSRAVKVADAKSPMPILQNVLISRAMGSRGETLCVVKATNLGCWVTLEFETPPVGLTELAEAVCVPAKELFALVKCSKSDAAMGVELTTTVTPTQNTSNCAYHRTTVSVGPVSVVLEGLPPEDFPLVEDRVKGKDCKLVTASEKLPEHLKRLLPFAARDKADSRWQECVCLRPGMDNPTAFVTDGNHAAADTEFPMTPGLPEVLVPRAVCDRLAVETKAGSWVVALKGGELTGQLYFESTPRDAGRICYGSKVCDDKATSQDLDGSFIVETARGKGTSVGRLMAHVNHWLLVVKGLPSRYTEPKQFVELHHEPPGGLALKFDTELNAPLPILVNETVDFPPYTAIAGARLKLALGAFEPKSTIEVQAIAYVTYTKQYGAKVTSLFTFNDGSGFVVTVMGGNFDVDALAVPHAKELDAWVCETLA